MKKCIALMCCVMLILSACAADKQSTESKKAEALPAGLKYSVPGLPAIDSFSGVEYEDYTRQFSQIKSVTYKHDGIEEKIPNDDERILRMLNFIAYSHNERLVWYKTRYIEELEIVSYENVVAPMIIVEFWPQDTSNSVLSKAPKIMVCGDQCLIFMNTPSSSYYWVPEGERLAEIYYPYMALTKENNLGDWGTVTWLDILEYAGFYTTDNS